MKTLTRLGAVALAGLAAAPVVSVAQTYDPGRLYGRVTTMDGSVYEGFIRWDQNEGHWTDVIDANKRLPRRFFREAAQLSGRPYRDRGDDGIRVFGLTIRSESDNWPQTATSAIRFGHVTKITVLDDDFALLALRSGQEQELRRSSTDLGTSNRGIFVRETQGRETELDWNDLDFVEFLPAPEGAESPYGARLFGTVETRAGTSFTGWVTWDMDEIFGEDVLDGEDGRDDLEIAFKDIQSIERVSSNSAHVVLTSGREHDMRGTNDVNDGNRGILIGDPNLGQVTVQWDEFQRVRFMDPPQSLPYEEFAGSWRLSGTVYTADGEAFAGAIRWDNDEEWSWEMLGGDDRSIEYNVEFGAIQAIRKTSSRGADVTLWDGRTLDLRNSNDVNDDNKGIFIQTDAGETALVRWEEFERVEFRR
jgi:hypothetical protein